MIPLRRPLSNIPRSPVVHPRSHLFRHCFVARTAAISCSIASLSDWTPYLPFGSHVAPDLAMASKPSLFRRYGAFDV